MDVQQPAWSTWASVLIERAPHHTYPEHIPAANPAKGECCLAEGGMASMSGSATSAKGSSAARDMLSRLSYLTEPIVHHHKVPYVLNGQHVASTSAQEA